MTRMVAVFFQAMRPWLTNFLFVLLVTCLGAMKTLGCDCRAGKAPCQEFWEADAVFAGTVISSGTIEIDDGYKHQVRLVHLKVDQPLRGIKTAEVDVQTGWGGGDCGYGFQLGERYLVYAFRNAKDQHLSTSICTRTRLLSQAGDDFAFVRSLSTSDASGVIFGTILRRRYQFNQGDVWRQGVREVEVTIEGDRARYDAMSDENGKFRVPDVLPGNYFVKLKLPPGLMWPPSKDQSGLTAESEVKVVAHGCAESSFFLEPDTRVSGRVVDANGNPVGTLSLNLRGATANKNFNTLFFTTTDANGHFEFKTVAPGDYWVGYRLLSSGSQDGQPYPRTYLPGVPTKALATVVTVKEGEKLSDLAMQLPPPLTRRTVKVSVVWADGHPVTGALIYVSLIEEGETSASWSVEPDDDEGHFTLALYDGLQYKISAFERFTGGKQSQSEYVDVPLIPDAAPIILVLPPPTRK